MNLPNKLTLLRVFIVPAVAAILLIGRGNGAETAALILYIAAMATDYADGYLARKYQLITNFGRFMDPLADKLLVLSVLICMVSLGKAPAWAVILVLAREISISGFRLIAAERGIVISAGKLGKIKTTLQNFWIVSLLLPFDGQWTAVLSEVLMWCALLLTVVSFVGYIKTNIRVLKEN